MTHKHTPEIIRKFYAPACCDICGEDAKERHTYLLKGDARSNPASSAYGMDNCSWCSDYENYGCGADDCHRELKNEAKELGYSWCSTFEKNDRFQHMFQKKMEEPFPELLEALETITAKVQGLVPASPNMEENPIWQAIFQANTAIKKARGE